MYQYWKIILVLLCLGSRLPAEESKMKPEIRAAFSFLLNEDPLAAEEQKQLAITLLKDFEEISDLLHDVERAGVGAASERAEKMIKRLEEGRGQLKIHGATFGWYLILEDQKFRALPLVIKVEDGSPAADAGLLPGDVIDRCEGRDLKSDDSRNRL
jgi:S1-C subfamily serine protease